MSLLLKSSWRSLLHSAPLKKSLRSANFHASLSMKSRVRQDNTSTNEVDVVTTQLRAAKNSTNLLTMLQTLMPTMSHRHMMQVLRSLFELQKASKHKNDSDIVNNPTFTVFCQNLKKYAPALEVNETIEATKVLSYLNVPVDSLIVQTMLQLIRCNINDIGIRQIMFLHFILNQFDQKNHLVDALKLALPLAFQIHLPLELDHEDLPLLKDMLAYCCAHGLPDRCINNVVTALLLHDQRINAQTSKSIIWSLCQVNCTEEFFPTRVQLLHICYDILSSCMDELSYEDVLRTAAKIKTRVLEKHPEYYHEQMMDSIANYMVQNDVGFEKGLLMARVLSRIAHTHLGLVSYLCKLAAADKTTLTYARTNMLFGFINVLSNNNYIPSEHWEDLREQISRNRILEATNSALPWTKICLELASLGHYEDNLLKRVFSKEFLREFLDRDNNNLDYLQLLTVQEAVNAFHEKEYKLPPEVLEKAKTVYPMHAHTQELQQHLERGLGEGCVARNVVLPNGFVADLVLSLKGGYPMKLSTLGSDQKLPIGKLNLPQGSVAVCIMNFNQGCFSMNSNRLRGTFRLIVEILEKLNYVAVPINVSEWLAAPAHERTPYLLREIGYKCGEMGMKLSAT